MRAYYVTVGHDDGAHCYGALGDEASALALYEARVECARAKCVSGDTVFNWYRVVLTRGERVLREEVVIRRASLLCDAPVG